MGLEFRALGFRTCSPCPRTWAAKPEYWSLKLSLTRITRSFWSHEAYVLRGTGKCTLNSKCYTSHRISDYGTHTCMHACMHACIHTYIHTYVRTYAYFCIHSRGVISIVHARSLTQIFCPAAAAAPTLSTARPRWSLDHRCKSVRPSRPKA